jgi:hypothetical protein
VPDLDRLSVEVGPICVEEFTFHVSGYSNIERGITCELSTHRRVS